MPTSLDQKPKLAYCNMRLSEPITVLDLPQLYTQPSAADLITTLELLAIEPASWDPKTRLENGEAQAVIDEAGIPKYLTGIVSSQLSWIKDERRDEIWEAASKRLSERSGRTGVTSSNHKFKWGDLTQ